MQRRGSQDRGDQHLRHVYVRDTETVTVTITVTISVTVTINYSTVTISVSARNATATVGAPPEVAVSEAFRDTLGLYPPARRVRCVYPCEK